MAKRRKSREVEADKPVELTIPLPKDGFGSADYWIDQIDQSERRIKKEIPLWRANNERYDGGRPTLRGFRQDDVITVPVDYGNTEAKKAQLCNQTPFVQLTPKRSDCVAAAPMAQKIANHILSKDETNAKLMLDDVLQDILCPAGLGVTKIGYDRIAEKVEVQIDPAALPDPLTGAPPPMQTIDRVIWEKYFWDRFSPADLRIPTAFLSTRYDEAPWLGMRFLLDEDARKRYGMSRKDRDGGGVMESDTTLARTNDREFQRSAGCGYDVWYRAYLYDDAVQNPEHIRHLVILKTRKDSTVVLHDNSPYQVFSPTTKQFVKGMKGFPIHVFTTRTITDCAYPKSDCSHSRPLVDERSSAHSQQAIQRRLNIPLRWADKSRMSKPDIGRLERAEIQNIILTEGPGDQMLGEVPRAHYPPENAVFDQTNKLDIATAWGFDINQLGVQSSDPGTATEAALVQRAADARMSNERVRFLGCFLEGVAKLFPLYQLFADEAKTLEILGPDGAQQLATWDKNTIAGEYAFDAKPESTQRIDAAENREVTLRKYNLVANDPLVNRGHLLTELAEAFDDDPSKMIVQTPPEPQPEQPKITLSFKGEDLFNPLVLDLLAQSGFKIDPASVQNAIIAKQMGIIAPTATEKAAQKGQPAHGGAAKPIDPIDKHDAALTGQRTGPPPLQ